MKDGTDKLIERPMKLFESSSWNGKKSTDMKSRKNFGWKEAKKTT